MQIKLLKTIPMNLLTAEFLLNIFPNGGSVVLFRAIWVSFIFYSLAIGLKSITTPNATFEFSLQEFVYFINSTIPWFGAIFAGAYTALYTRFSSQWSYLTDLYNQQMAAALNKDLEGFNQETYKRWQAAFVEDAVAMHLATKTSISMNIHHLLNDSEVWANLSDEELFGSNKLIKLKEKLEKKHGNINKYDNEKNKQTPTIITKTDNSSVTIVQINI